MQLALAPTHAHKYAGSKSDYLRVIVSTVLGKHPIEVMKQLSTQVSLQTSVCMSPN
jgi:hypothetical protein